MAQKNRRPSWERHDIREIMKEKNLKYTEALHEYDRRKAAAKLNEKLAALNSQE
jgi:hypothetical protein